MDYASLPPPSQSTDDVDADSLHIQQPVTTPEASAAHSPTNLTLVPPQPSSSSSSSITHQHHHHDLVIPTSVTSSPVCYHRSTPSVELISNITTTSTVPLSASSSYCYYSQHPSLQNSSQPPFWHSATGNFQHFGNQSAAFFTYHQIQQQQHQHHHHHQQQQQQHHHPQQYLYHSQHLGHCTAMGTKLLLILLLWFIIIFFLHIFCLLSHVQEISLEFLRLQFTLKLCPDDSCRNFKLM